MRERALSLGGEVCLESATRRRDPRRRPLPAAPNGVSPPPDANHSHAVQGTLH